MTHLEPDEPPHGTTGRDVTVILICIVLLGFVFSTLEQVPA